MNEAKIKEVFSDEAFVKELLEKETPEEVQEILEKKDIELSIEEIVNLREMLVERIENAQSDDEELLEDDLESVSGGCIDPCSIIVTVVCIACMTCIVAGIVDGATKDCW